MDPRRSQRLLAAAALVPLCLLAACGGGGGANRDSGEILVGHYGSMTGSEATFGQSTDQGIALAIDEINAAGGINGRMLRILTYDTQGKSQEAGNCVTRLINNDRVTALLGEVASSLSIAGGRIAQQYGVPMITPSSTNAEVTKIGDRIFRVCFVDSFQGEAGATFARDSLHLSKAAVLYDQGAAYSAGLKDDFRRAFEALGGTVTTQQAYTGGDQDYSAQLTTIRASEPEVLYVPGYYTDVGNIALQARKLGISIPLLGGDGWDSSQLSAIAGPAIEGSYYTNHYSPDEERPAVKVFVTKYNEKFHRTPDGLAALGYDAARILADAMKRAKSLDGADLSAAIAATKDFPGVTGIITIDENRNARKPAVVVQMRNGRPAFVVAIQPR